MSRRPALTFLLLPLMLLLALCVPAGPASATGPAAGSSPVSSAAASPGHAGGRICGVRYCIYAYVDGHVHADALSASGTVKVVDAGVPIARLQVDRVTVGTGFSTAVNGGPKNLGSSAPVTQTVSATVPGHSCQGYLTTVFASGRLSDGSVISGSVSGIVYYSDYGICPGPTLATSTSQLAPSTAPGGAGSVTVVKKTMNSNDGTRGFTNVQVTLRGVAGATPHVLRAHIDRIELSTGRADVTQPDYLSDGGDVAVGATKSLFNRTYAALWPAGCGTFYGSATISVRYSDGSLIRTDLPDTAHQHCS